MTFQFFRLFYHLIPPLPRLQKPTVCLSFKRFFVKLLNIMLTGDLSCVCLAMSFLRRNKLKTLKSLIEKVSISGLPKIDQCTTPLDNQKQSTYFQERTFGYFHKMHVFLLWAYLGSALIEQLILSIIAALSADLVQPTFFGSNLKGVSQ